MKKWKNLRFLTQLLGRHPQGLSEIEIAEIINVTRRTANNYLRELEEDGQVQREGTPHKNTRWFLAE